nr:MAG TPA: prolyl-tRNA synthetase [Bacteriophage sp.]
MTLEDTGWLSVPFCGPDSCETRFITKRLLPICLISSP